MIINRRGSRPLALVAIISWVLLHNTSAQPISSATSATTPFLDLLWNYRNLFIRGTWVTIQLSVTSMALAMTLGLCLALMRLYGTRFLSRLALGYIEFVRGTPLLVQLFFIYYGLPQLPGVHLKLSAMAAAIIGVGLNYSAYEAEIYRAGIMAIPRAQTEAGLALGLTRWQTIRLVILPQALRLVVPPVTNDFVALFKDTSIVSVVAISELTQTFRNAGIATQRYLEFAIVTALIYFTISYPISKFARHLEKRIHPHHDFDTQPL
jgi:polar amino acid transport system substrate-binding protein